MRGEGGLVSGTQGFDTKSNGRRGDTCCPESRGRTETWKDRDGRTTDRDRTGWETDLPRGGTQKPRFGPVFNREREEWSRRTVVDLTPSGDSTPVSSRAPNPCDEERCRTPRT